MQATIDLCGGRGNRSSCEGAHRSPPGRTPCERRGNYLERCRVALTVYENGGELPPGWSMPPVCSAIAATSFQASRTAKEPAVSSRRTELFTGVVHSGRDAKWRRASLQLRAAGGEK